MKILLILLIGAASPAADIKESSFVVAGLRMMPERWNKQANFVKIERFARQAASRGAQLVLTPESFLDGYVANEGQNQPFHSMEKYLMVGEPMDGPFMGKIRALARELHIHLLVGFAERRGEEMFNSVALFSPEGKLLTRYSKTHTGGVEPHNRQGTEFSVMETPLARLGALICLDRQLPETSRILAIKGAQMILVPAWGAYGEMNTIMMRTRAYENGVWVAFVHPNRALIIDPGGKIVAQDDPEGGDQVVTAKITIDAERKRGPIRHRRPEIYSEILTR